MSQHHPAQQAGRMIVIASGKGGVGKTWFSISLAQALARQGRRVLLADADLGLANIDVQLGIQPANDLSAVLAGRMTISQAATHLPNLGFDVLVGRSGSGALASLGPAALDAFLGALTAARQHWQDVVVDLGAGLDVAQRRRVEAEAEGSVTVAASWKASAPSRKAESEKGVDEGEKVSATWCQWQYFLRRSPMSGLILPGR
mgnify:CR=1 FL=1